MDLTQLSDDDLDQHRRDALIEQERRRSLELIPGQINELREKFAAGGGNPADLEGGDLT